MRKIAILFSLVFCMLACQRGEDSCSSDPQANLDALWTLIDEHYCFLDYKATEIGLDWNQVHSKYSCKLNPEMSRSQLFEVLCEMLGELQDGHVNLLTSIDLGRYWNWKDDYPANFDQELRESYLGKEYKISAGVKYRILEDNIGYVVYESFSDGIGEGNLDDILYYMRTCNGLIVDVRGNGGGTLTYAERLAQRFTNEKILVGYMQHKTGKGHSQFSKPVEEYLEPSAGVRWQKKAIVLANRGCYSATNTFVRDIKECPNVTVLGDRTGGGSGLPFSSELPIGWSVRFSACPSFDARMQQIEFGIEPDIYCSLDSTLAAKGVDSLIEKARSLLKEEQQP